MPTMPEQKPGRSEQVVCTPPLFLKAVKNRFLNGEDFKWDLAASKENTVAEKWFTEADDALIQPWHELVGALWCNPPFGDIEPWVAKASNECQMGAQVFMLLPASVGSNWWKSYVDKKSWGLFLNGRLTFVGHKSPYPKDLALLIYDRIFTDSSHYSVWNWRESL